ENVTPELVGAEPVLGARAGALFDQALSRRVERRQPRRERGAEREHDDERQAEQGEAIAPEARPGSHLICRRSGSAGLRRSTVGEGTRGVIYQPWRPTRGSRRPYERSTSRLMTTKASAKTSTAPCSST